MALLILVRHALTGSTGKILSGSTPGIHLSEQGRVQAAALADRLAPIPLGAVYASPLERCRETAEPIAASRGLGVQALPDVVEVGYGRWTGRSLAQLRRTALWKKVQHVPSAVRFPEGESLAEAQLRAVSALDRLAARHGRSAVAVVSHADVIRLSVAHYLGIHLDLFQRVVVGPASVTAIAVGDGVPHVLRLNDTGSLGDLAARPAVTRRPRRDA